MTKQLKILTAALMCLCMNGYSSASGTSQPTPEPIHDFKPLPKPNPDAMPNPGAEPGAKHPVPDSRRDLDPIQGKNKTSPSKSAHPQKGSHSSQPKKPTPEPLHDFKSHPKPHPDAMPNPGAEPGAKQPVPDSRRDLDPIHEVK